LLTGFVLTASGEEVVIIKNPAPNCVESSFTELVKCGEVADQADSDEFLVRPMSLVVDERGYVFVYDSHQAGIFQYDSKLNLVRTFGNRGRGPGEIGLQKYSMASMVIKGKEIYLPDAENRKILCFSTNGKMVREIPMKNRRSLFYKMDVDASRNIYLTGDRESMHSYVVDVYTKNGEYQGGILDKEKLLTGLFFKAEFISRFKHKVPDRFRVTWYSSGPGSNCHFAITDGNMLLINSSTSGYYWVYKKGKLYKSGRLWPRDALKDYRIRLKRSLKKNGFFPFFPHMFLDKDDPDCFFLYYGYFHEGSRLYLYKFDLSGKLHQVYYVQDPKRRFAWFRFKRHGKFYAITNDGSGERTVSVFEERESQ